MSGKPILCLDFDGVIHQYDSPWEGPTVIKDGYVPGVFEFIDAASEFFKIVVYSSRSKEPGGCDAMAIWMAVERKKWRDAGGKSPKEFGGPIEIEFSDKKPAAFLTIDDRGYQFNGAWPDPRALLDFKPWNKRPTASKVVGVSRMADNDRAVLVGLKDHPTDDELRSLHEFLRNWR